MELTPQQERAIKACRSWFKSDTHNQQIFRIFGYAGTGKTTIAKLLAADCGNVAFATFTGKASLVLRKRGCAGATTLHSLAYVATRDERTGKLFFHLRDDSPLRDLDLLVVDEVSMVGPDLGEDVCSFGVPILVLGDPGQLPPIRGEGFFTGQQPDVMLTDIQRQAKDNPIIAMSMHVREGKLLSPGHWGDTVEVLSQTQMKRRYDQLLLDHDMIITGTNSTRRAVNINARRVKGLQGEFQPWHPVAGDRLICLRNDRHKGFLNGSLWGVNKVEDFNNDFKLNVTGEDIDLTTDITTLRDFFSGSEEGLDWKLRLNYDEFTFAQAVTCHKSQGSSWHKTMVIDQSRVFKDNSRQWLYTAVTRAEEELTICL